VASGGRRRPYHAVQSGLAAVDRDFLHALLGSFPYVLGLVLLLTMILLLRAAGPPRAATLTRGSRGRVCEPYGLKYLQNSGF
jgi:hypothetical protein